MTFPILVLIALTVSTLVAIAWGGIWYYERAASEKKKPHDTDLRIFGGDTAPFNAALGVRDFHRSLGELQLQEVVRLIHRAVCYNQGFFMQFSFLSAERHKEMRLQYQKKQKQVTLEY